MPDTNNGMSGNALPTANNLPSPLSIDAGQVAKARAAGYSDAEIVNFLAPRAPEQFTTALKAGYSPTEILEHLAPEPQRGPWENDPPVAANGQLTRVTDPALLARLNGSGSTEAPKALTQVTDPDVLKKLNSAPWNNDPVADQQPSGVVDSARQGTADVLSGVAKTLETHGYGGKVSGALENAAKYVEPQSFTPASLIDKQGFHSGNIGAWLAQRAPEALAMLLGGGAAAVAAPEALATAAPIAGAAATGWLTSAGNEAQQAATKRTGDPNAKPNTADVVRGDLTAAAENAVGALPVTRYLPGAGKLANTGAAGAMRALRKLGVTAVDQGAASAGANTAEQVGQTIGTPGGVNVDPNQVVDSAAGGALTGAVFGAPKATREALDAAKYRGITPDLQQAATQVANRVVQNADGENLQGSLLRSGPAQRAGLAAVRKTGLDIRNELDSAVSDLRSRVALPVDADNALRAAMNGQQPNASGYAALEAAVASDPQGANVLNLVRQAHAFDVLNDSGHHVGDKFTGGVGGFFRHILTGENVAKSAMVGLGAAALEEGAGHLIAYSPTALSMAAGGAALARLLDNVTGAQAPAGRFVRNFADDNTPIRVPVSQATIDRVSRPGPTGPRIPLAPQPWGSPQPASPAELLTPAQKQQMVQEAMPALRALARMSKPAPEINPLALPKNITAPAATLMRGAALAQQMREAATATPAPPEPDIPLNPMALPTSITGPIRNIMRGVALAQRLSKAQQPGTPATTSPATEIARGAASGPVVPPKVTKAADGTVSVNKRPVAPYSALPVPEAANRILRDKLAAGVPIENSRSYLAKIHAMLNTVREKVKAVQEAAPSIPAADVARFEGVRSQKAAKQYRELLKADFPQAAGVLDKVFSDAAIATQWGQKQ